MRKSPGDGDVGASGLIMDQFPEAGVAIIALETSKSFSLPIHSQPPSCYRHTNDAVQVSPGRRHEHQLCLPMTTTCLLLSCQRFVSTLYWAWAGDVSSSMRITAHVVHTLGLLSRL